MGKSSLTPTERREALELEFDRLKERADQIDGFLQGHPDAWFRIKVILEDAKHIASVELDKAVAEGRQNALAMATVAKTLAGLGSEEVPVSVKDPLEKMEDELAAKRAQKNA